MNRLLIGGLLGGFLAVLAIPPFRGLFNLVLPGPKAWAVIVGSVLVASVLLKLALAIGRHIATTRFTAVEE